MSQINRSPNMEELLDAAIESHLSELHTSTPAKVLSYDSNKQTVDVKPMIKRLIGHSDSSESSEPLPVIYGVPVLFYRTKNTSFTLPIKKGDFVILHFCDSSIDNFYSSSGQDSDPDEFRKHDLSDAVAVPCFFPYSSPIPDVDSNNVSIGFHNGVKIDLTDSGEMKISVNGISDESVMLAKAFERFWNYQFKPFFDAHLHTSVTSGGPTSPPTPGALGTCPNFPSNAISKVLKVKS